MGSPAPRPSEGQECPSRAEGWSAPCCYCLVFCVWFWVTGIQARRARALARTFCPLPQVFFRPSGPRVRIFFKAPCPNFFKARFFLETSPFVFVVREVLVLDCCRGGFSEPNFVS